MSYAIIAFVVVAIIVVAMLAFRRKPAESLPPTGPTKKLEPKVAPEAQAAKAQAAKPQAAKPQAAEPQTAPPAQKPAPAADRPQAPSNQPEPEPALPQEPAAVAPSPGPASASPPERASMRPTDIPGLRKGLAKARAETGFLGRLAQLFAGKKEIDPNIADRLEEILLTSDVGVGTTQTILDRLRDGLRKNQLSSPQAVWDALRAESARILGLDGGRLHLPAKPTVVFVVGVNGVGKTTSIGKLATKLTSEGKTVLLAAGDTFRAAAVQQLEIWGRRVGCEVVKGKEGADPAAVIFDAIQRAKEKNVDVVLADSAGRLQTKVPLMDELKKIARTMQKALDGAPHETLLVLDATNGQNATSQARMFQEAIPLTGIILTKLDGTAKGGVILGICDELKIPVRYVGIGERAEDLREFIADEFVEALFGRSADETAAA